MRKCDPVTHRCPQSLIRITLALILFIPILASAASLEDEIQLRIPTLENSTPQPVLSKKERNQYEFCCFPDMPLGVMRNFKNTYYFFGAGSGGHLSNRPIGTYRLTGSPDQMIPATEEDGTFEPSLNNGRAQPSPDGRDFDRDYAGGGPVYFLNGPEALLSGRDTSSDHNHTTPLLHLYHGEFHYIKGEGMPAYGGLGMAISANDGKTFRKLGQVLAPAIPRDSFYTWTKLHSLRAGLWSDGSLIEADGKGRPIDMTSRSSDDRYYYLIFTDRASLEANEGFALARVKKTEALDAIRHQRAPLFKKYFIDGDKSRSEDNSFTEPGIGGRSTLVVSGQGHLAQPMVLYDIHLKLFVLCNMEQQKKITLRFSDTLFNWSRPVTVFEETSPDNRVYYPTIVGTGDDPYQLGSSFYLYFLEAEMKDHDNQWKNSSLMRTTVTFTSPLTK